MRTVTQWFNGNVKPARVGWYERSFMDRAVAYWFFDGAEWRSGGYFRPIEWVNRNASPDQNLPWRGLAEKP